MINTRNLPSDGYYYYFSDVNDFDYMEANEFIRFFKKQRKEKRRTISLKWTYAGDKNGLVNHLLSYLRPIRDSADMEIRFYMEEF